ncbi:hypothetical protein EG68_03948 [Paragonimus skrjabini miyazakii]|uniref:Uncharacterized protein n=1 Tax=Paragonimus skrjabini miyazakii TaxID=59628 RepID=A0A8S9Z021_9TREM|nr:hypothetical protein EG68_03948 [Paragonimus skrjabini miyazakii]
MSNTHACCKGHNLNKCRLRLCLSSCSKPSSQLQLFIP